VSPTLPALNYAPCTVRHVRHSLLSAECEQCGQPARRVWERSRSAIDIDLDHPVLLLVTVSVHRCPDCSRYFRAQPSFLRKNAVYAERVRQKAVLSVYEDGMPFRRVTGRLARDFWVKPSEAMIRRWCRDYSDGLDFEGDYQAWVVEEFSGVLCVDEVYQDKLALLLAVDPATPDGDRLVGYELIHGQVERKDVEDFLSRLKCAGIEPEEVVTDGSPLYPNSLKGVWPTAAHQLCLFHESRLVTAEIYKAREGLRKVVPKPPMTPSRRGLLGRPRKKCPSPEKLGAHRAAIARVLTLHEQGVSIRGIRRRTGHSRNTIKRWLRGEIPKEIVQAELPTEWILEEILGEGVASEQGEEEQPLIPEAPSPWSSWEEVRKVRNLLWDVRYVILRRPEQLTEKDREKLEFLFESPVGEEVRLLRGFLEEWYSLFFYDEQRRSRRTLEEAKERYDRLKDNPDYQKLEHLAGLQARLCEEHFLKISRFLEHEEWEATNNGVERTGRAFRHLQRSRYNFRKPVSIENAIRAKAWLAKQGSSPRSTPPPGRCARGRKVGWRSGVPAAA
jgi:lambda repressor-like predicted transcriptional regulator